jgi:hypothetical protein
LSGAGAPDRSVCRSPGSLLEFQVHDVLFVLLIIGVFVGLAIIAKGAEKL